MIYDATNLPHPSHWGAYMKVNVRAAARMDCPFEVWTDEGVVSCEDGWLVLDDHGNPFAVSAEEFEAIYRPAGDVLIMESKDQRMVRALDIMNRVRRLTS